MHDLLFLISFGQNVCKLMFSASEARRKFVLSDKQESDGGGEGGGDLPAARDGKRMEAA